jgi:isocitrate/isopropylmalate dehydrogenase
MAGLSAVLEAGRTLTRDLGGTASTREFADAVCRAVDGRPDPVG